jgi:hypothetical protein
MTVDELHQLHVQKLAQSFGVSTALGAFRDDRVARAFGNPDTEHSETEKAKVEY